MKGPIRSAVLNLARNGANVLISLSQKTKFNQNNNEKGQKLLDIFHYLVISKMLVSCPSSGQFETRTHKWLCMSGQSGVKFLRYFR